MLAFAESRLKSEWSTCPYLRAIDKQNAGSGGCIRRWRAFAWSNPIPTDGDAEPSATLRSAAAWKMIAAWLMCAAGHAPATSARHRPQAIESPLMHPADEGFSLAVVVRHFQGLMQGLYRSR